MARRLGLTFDHFTPFAMQFVALCDHRQRRAVVLFVALFRAEQRAPARLSQKARFGDEFAARSCRIKI